MSASKKTTLGLGAATIIGINAMRGAGIFAMPASLALVVGPAGLFSFVLAGLAIITIVLSLGRLTILVPSQSWGYEYPARWGGHRLGMFVSSAYLIGVVVAMGFLAQQAGIWIVGSASPAAYAWGTGIVVALTALILGGAQVAAGGQYVIAACVLVPMLAMGYYALQAPQLSHFTPWAPYGWGKLCTALPAILFSLLGFESIASLSSVVEKPQYTVPRAAFLSVAIVVGMYMAFVASVWALIPQGAFSGGVDTTLAVLVERYLPQADFLRLSLWIGALCAIVGTLHSMIWSIGVLGYEVLKKSASPVIVGLYERRLLREHHVAIVISALTLVAMFSFKGSAILSIAPVLIVPSYLCSVCALLGMKQEWRSWSILLTLAAIASCIVLLAFSCRGVWEAFVC